MCRQELGNVMTFQSESEAKRERKKLEMIRFPPVVQPKTDTKVSQLLFSPKLTSRYLNCCSAQN
jgi:hypothetical protein